jgi:hypothetical protein
MEADSQWKSFSIKRHASTSSTADIINQWVSSSKIVPILLVFPHFIDGIIDMFAQPCLFCFMVVVLHINSNQWIKLEAFFHIFVIRELIPELILLFGVDLISEVWFFVFLYSRFAGGDS